jgi:hypothetical protein
MGGEMQGLNIILPHMVINGRDVATQLAKLLADKIGQALYITINTCISNAVDAIKFESVYLSGHYPKNWPKDIETKAMTPTLMDWYEECLKELYLK